MTTIGKEYTVEEAATLLGVTTKTIRNRIKDGRIEAYTVEGKYGQEWRITGIESVEGVEKESLEDEDTTALDTTAKFQSIWKPFLDQINKLATENQRLALELGASQEREKQATESLRRALENSSKLQEQLKLLEVPIHKKKRWQFWK